MKQALLRPYTHGYLLDGRTFQIKEFTKITVTDDGNINYASLPSDILR